MDHGRNRLFRGFEVPRHEEARDSAAQRGCFDRLNTRDGEAENIRDDLADFIALRTAPRDANLFDFRHTSHSFLDALHRVVKLEVDAFEQSAIDMHSRCGIAEPDDGPPHFGAIKQGAPIRLKHQAVASGRNVAKQGVVVLGIRVFIEISDFLRGEFLQEPIEHPEPAVNLNIRVVISRQDALVAREETNRLDVSL